jgi:hypothetical protein
MNDAQGLKLAMISFGEVRKTCKKSQKKQGRNAFSALLALDERFFDV